MAQQIQSRGRRKQRTGVVLSHRMQNTAIVKVERKVRHPVYGKEMVIAEKMYAHDERDEAKAGDRVLIEETRPLSKLKRWRLVKVLHAATAAAQTGSNQ